MESQTVYSTLLDESGKIISCNNSLRKQLGIQSPSQLIGKNILDVFKAWEIDKLSKAIETCKANPEIIVTISVRYKSDTTSANVFEWTISGETNDEGQCTIHLIGRNQGPAAPVKHWGNGNVHSENIYEEFMNHSPLVGWVTDEEGIMQYMNPIYLSTYNLSKEDIGKSLFEIFPKEIADEYFANNRNVLDSNKAIETIEKGIRANGQQQILKIFKFPIQVEGQRMVAGWAIDMTDQLQLQEELTKNVERYYFVKKATSDAIYDWDIEKKVIFRGIGFQTLFGYHHLRGSVRYGLKLVHPGDLERVKALMFSSLRDEQVTNWNIAYRFRDHDGHYKYIIDKAYIIRKEGKAVRVIGAMQDISEQRMLQQKLVQQEKSNKRKLVKSIIDAQEKERRQLSVELHDNVNQILSSCKLMLEAAQANEQMASSLIAKTGSNLQNAITEIRKISHELNPSALQDIGLAEAVTQMISDVNLSGKMRIDFVHEGFDDKHRLKEEDRIAIFRIIQEKLNNIIRHSKAKNALIYLSLVKDRLKLIMKDDGVGFDISKVKKGIGIRNIQNRVEYYQGTMQFKTAPGKGCIMEIHIRLKKGR